ncbi:type II secretion system F family protein [Sphingomonas colocasiae]|uniref:Type II secretion system F family protein n=1 Tax=Sphingomonas colocasiae TaxID=1848973 RepID=A0ABS7PYM5_9SPHN|nr:type II secretion system F family protein [Sphingomonas colocasiae]MBY8826481.1 type II secretion system F family protein [Sphingomonas colocasiae]
MFDLALPPVSRGILLTLIFVSVAILVLLVSNLMSTRSAVRRRLADTQSLAKGGGEGLSLRNHATRNAWTTLVETIEKNGISLADTNQGLRAKLIAAGYPSPLAPRLFTLVRLVSTLVLPAGFLALQILSQHPLSLMKLYFFGAGLALFGLYAPNMWLSAKVERRQQELVNGFPDALDLMLVCVEAGLGVEAAFDRVGREMAISHPLVSRMLGEVVLQLRAGQSREEALRRMAESVKVDEIRSFATLIIQSDKLGSSIGQTLRIYSAEMREKRRMRAEEKAHRLPVLLSIPLVACMLPVMIGVLMLPAGIRVVRLLLPALYGGQ